MKQKKKQISIISIITVILLLLFQITTYAHSGRTDSSGGHKDNKNKSGLGSYHYHCGGHPPHLHTNGVCPYSSSKGTTTKTPSSSSSKTPTQKTTPVPTPTPKVTPKKTEEIEIKDIEVNSVKIMDQSKKELQIGENLNLSAEVKPSNATNQTIIWESSDTNIATITPDGTVNAISAGTVEISAKSNNGVKDSVSITVKSPVIEVSNISLDIAESKLNIGSESVIQADIFPAEATNKTIKWSSSDESIVKVQDGKIIAVSSGEATITAESENGVKSMCKITVPKPAKSESEVYIDEDKGISTIIISIGMFILGGIIGVGIVLLYKRKK